MKTVRGTRWLRPPNFHESDLLRKTAGPGGPAVLFRAARLNYTPHRESGPSVTHLGSHVAVPAGRCRAEEHQCGEADHGDQPHKKGVLDKAGPALTVEAAPARQVLGNRQEV